jgi:hypothetical protein
MSVQKISKVDKLLHFEKLKRERPCKSRRENCEGEGECKFSSQIKSSSGRCVDTSHIIDEYINLVCGNDIMEHGDLVKILDSLNLTPQQVNSEYSSFDNITQKDVCDIFLKIVRFVFYKFEKSEKKWQEIGMTKEGYEYFSDFVKKELKKGRSFWNIQASIYKKLNVEIVHKWHTSSMFKYGISIGLFLFIFVIVFLLHFFFMFSAAGGLAPALKTTSAKDKRIMPNIDTGEGVEISHLEPRQFLNEDNFRLKANIIGESLNQLSVLDYHITANMPSREIATSNIEYKSQIVKNAIESIKSSHMFRSLDFSSIYFKDGFQTVDAQDIVQNIVKNYESSEIDLGSAESCEIGSTVERSYVNLLIETFERLEKDEIANFAKDKDYGLIVGQQIYYTGGFNQEMITHHGVYIGNGLVYEVSMGPKSCKFKLPDNPFNSVTDKLFNPFGQVVGLATIENFAKRAIKQHSKLYVVETSQDDNPDIIIGRLKMMKDFGKWTYDPFNNNCQSAANSVTFGVFNKSPEVFWRSLQGEFIGDIMNKSLKVASGVTIILSVLVQKIINSAVITSFNFYFGEKGLTTNIPKCISHERGNIHENLLRWWEIRSWVHLADKTLIKDMEDIQSMRGVLIGVLKGRGNIILKETFERLNKEEGIVSSYFYKNERYRILSHLHEDTISETLFGEKGSAARSTGFIAINQTSNLDGNAGEVLYVCFRETTHPTQMPSWIYSVFNERYAVEYVNDIKSKNSRVFLKAEVHKGIWNAYNNGIRDQLKRVIRKFKYEERAQFDHIRKVIIVGKSLGGALSQCACLDMLKYFRGSQINMILYGSPKVYTPKTVNIIHRENVCCYRVEPSHFDDVCGFPHSFFVEWKHCGTAIKLNIVQEEMVYSGKSVEQNINAINEENYKISTYENGVERDSQKYFPTCLIFGPMSNKNFHTRANYQKYLYYLACKENERLRNIELFDI